MKLVVCSLIRNRMHPDCMFKEWLDLTKRFADLHIIVDNCSDDGTLEFLEGYKDSGHIVLVKNVEGEFGKEEARLRTMLWEAVRKYATVDDTWVMSLDADEFVEEKFVGEKERILEFLRVNDYGVMTFAFCDMWGLDVYRTDGLWSPFFPRLYKFLDEGFGVSGGGLHLGCVPAYITRLSNYVSELRIKHFSYHTERLRTEKSLYYNARATGVNKQHAETIMDSTPRISVFHEKRELPKILFCSLIKNRAWILSHFLKFVENLNYPGDKLEFFFIVNNSSDNSRELLESWAKSSRFASSSKFTIKTLDFEQAQSFERDWNERVISNMALMRTMHLHELRDGDCDFLFSVDSDILLHPEILNVNLLLHKDILSPVFWARWDSAGTGVRSLPQVWLSGGYETNDDFIAMLRKNKLCCQVGGLGACTLIHQCVARSNVSYQRVYNLPSNMRGEDRDFCVRAVCAGFDLWASTYIPALHVDRQEDLITHLERARTEKWDDKSVILFLKK